MNIKPFLIAGLLCCTLYSCVKEVGPALSLITVDKNELPMNSYQGYTDSFTVTTTTPWKLTVEPSSAADWMQVSATQGLAGTTVVKVKIVATAPPTATRSAVVTIRPADNSMSTAAAMVTIRQLVYNIDWQKRLGGTSGQEGYSIIPTSDGGYAAVGYTASNDGDVVNNHGSEDVWLVKLNAAGNVLWTKTFGGNDNDRAYSIIETPDHGFLLVGSTFTNNNGDIPATHGSYDALVIRTNANGDKIWSRVYGGNGGDEMLSVVNASNGGFVIAGYTSSNANGDVPAIKGNVDSWVFKIDGNGDMVWNKTYGGVDHDETWMIESIPGGGFFVAGTTNSNNTGDIPASHGGDDIFLLKLNDAGEKVSCKVFGSDNDDYLIDVKAVNNGAVLLSTTWGSNGDVPGSNGNEDVWVLKVNNDGDKVWSKVFGGDGNEEAGSMTVAADGSIWITAATRSNNNGDVPANHGQDDCWIVNLNADGNKLWTKLIGGTGEEYPYNIKTTTDGGVIVTGITESPTDSGDLAGAGNQRGYRDFWIAKLK